MSRTQFAMLGALLGAVAVGVWIIGADLTAGTVTDSISRRQGGLYMGLGAVAGFILFTLTAGREGDG